MTVKGARGRGASGASPSALLVACVLGGTVGTANAHPEFSALGTNRYVTAALFDGRLDVSDVLLEGTLVSSEERGRLDTNHDGHIDEAEVRAGEARLRAEGAAVVVELDGSPLTAGAGVEVGIELGGEPLAESAPIVVERRLSFPAAWTSGAHRLRIALLREPARLLDTEIGVVLGPGLVLSEGPDRVTFRGPRASALEERRGAFTFEAPAPPRHPPAGIGGIFLGIGAGGALALALGVRWCRSRRRSASP
jgi:hypothetical protein